MRKDKKHSKKHWNKNDNRREYKDDGKLFSPAKIFRPTIKSVTPEQIKLEEEAIAKFKSEHKNVCERCNQPIYEISTAMNDRTTGKLIHFDCAVAEIEKNEKLEQGDKISYIGNGRFGIVNYPNVHDIKHFSIKKIIEWEKAENKAEWRTEMSELYSHVH